ncbi:MAG: hypothetical protein JSS66_06985 [Armatimonadetes bacterium]|nr:hypothetical protein [Armatimonadota bacterium]
MQKYKGNFQDTSFHGVTLGNTQRCLRTLDLDELGDGSHYGTFDMLGLFSFRHWSVPRTIGFWLDLLDDLGVCVEWTTIHPDRTEWRHWYPSTIEVRTDPECVWTDGTIGGYCTEFYSQGMEIGNIVNPMGDCIDVGFGLERLETVVNGLKQPSRGECLRRTVLTLLDSGFSPGNKGGNYVLRRLLRTMRVENVLFEHPCMEEELQRHRQTVERYEMNKGRFPDKDPQWWWDTFGVNIDEVL